MYGNERITFEYTGEVRKVNDGEWFKNFNGDFVQWKVGVPSTNSFPVWKIVQ